MSTSLTDAATLQRLSRSFSVVKDGPLLKHTQSPEEVSVLPLDTRRTGAWTADTTQPNSRVPVELWRGGQGPSAAGAPE